MAEENKGGGCAGIALVVVFFLAVSGCVSCNNALENIGEGLKDQAKDRKQLIDLEKDNNDILRRIERRLQD